MIDPGHLTIVIGSRASIATTRPTALGRMFVGKTPREALALAPMLFAVCGAAQTEACARALAAAGADVPPGPGASSVAAEAIREHLMRIAVDWSRAMGEEPDLVALRAAHALPRTAAVELRGTAEALIARILAPVESLAVTGWYESQNSLGARLIRRVVDEGWADLGGIGALQDCETSALTLTSNDTRGIGGNGLLARLLARPAHLLKLLEEVAVPGPAIGPVATSRGILRHRATVSNGRIAAYDIVAPTDVNFAAGGPAQASLAACGPIDELPARLLVEAFDPCIPFSLRAA